MKSNKVKKPCNICFQPVSKKNGLQCQGACKKWAHFKCLNYTPGKIEDIKAGVLKITCPCPDCNKEEPKDILTAPRFTCTKTQCPANKLPVFGSVDDPRKEKNPLSRPSPPTSPSPPPISPGPPPRPSRPPPKSPPPQPPPSAPSKPPPCPSPKCPSPKLCPPPPTCPPRNSSSPCPPVIPPICPSYQKVKNTKQSFSPKQSQSLSNVSNESSASAGQFDKIRSISSDSKLSSAGVDPKILFAAIKSLCNTVGQLSNQLRSLMFKMQASYGP